MDDLDFEPVNSSSKLGLLFGSNCSSSDKSLLRYNGEKEQIEKTPKTPEKQASSRASEQSDKPVFACLVMAKRINDGSVTSQEKVGLALLKTSPGIFELFLYKDMKNILWRTNIQPDSEYKIIGEYDVMIEDQKSSAVRWKIKFRDASERTDFLSKIVQCRSELPSVLSHPSLLKQKVILGSEEITLNKTMRIRLRAEEYGKGKIVDLEKNLFEWNNGQNFLEDEGVGCVFVVALWESQFEELNIPHGTLISLTVEEILGTSLEFMQRRDSNDQIDGKKMSDVEITPKHNSLKDRMSNIGYATPLVAAGSSDSLATQKEPIVNIIDPTHSSRPSSSLQISKSFPINNSEPGPSSFREDATGVSAKLDMILKKVTSLDAARETSAQNFNFIDPFIILSSINKIVDDNRTLKEEVKEKQGKIENLSEKLAELALALKSKISDGGNEELHAKNQKLNEELEESQVQCCRMDEEIIALNLKISSLDGQRQEKHRETEELRSRITSLEALLKTKEYEIGNKLKAELATRRSIESNLKETKLLADTAMNSRDKLATHVVEVHRKHSLEIQKTREECNDKIKKIMNQVYKKLSRSFQPNIQYSGDSIKVILKECVREVTLTYVDTGEKSCSSSSDISHAPKKETKILPGTSTSELKANEFKSAIPEPTKTINNHQDAKRSTEGLSKIISQPVVSGLSESSSSYIGSSKNEANELPSSYALTTNVGGPKTATPDPKRTVSTHQGLRKSTERSSKVIAQPIISEAYGSDHEVVEEESYDIPPVKRNDGSEPISPPTQQSMFGDGLSHVRTPEILPEPSLPVVVKKPLERYSGSPVLHKKDIVSETSPDISAVSPTVEKNTEQTVVVHSPIAPDDSSSVDKSTELREAINVKIAEGVREYTPEPPPPPEFVIDSDSESDWLE